MKTKAKCGVHTRAKRGRKAGFADIEVCVLAGGLSSRMGRDKSKLRLGRKTLISTLRGTVESLAIPMRIIRRDLVPRCGPLGGIYTGLKTSSKPAVLFLACDMPGVSARLLSELIQQFALNDNGLFCVCEQRAGFPLILPQRMLPLVEQLIQKNCFSLQLLAAKTQARLYPCDSQFQGELLNLNTPEEWLEFKNKSAKTS